MIKPFFRNEEIFLSQYPGQVKVVDPPSSVTLCRHGKATAMDPAAQLKGFSIYIWIRPLRRVLSFGVRG